MRRLGLTTCAAFLLGALPALGDTIASPPIYGGLSQRYFFCYVFNAGNTAINITEARLYTDTGSTGVLTQQCSASIQPGKTCQVTFAVLNTTAYLCKFTLSNKTNARGSVEVRDANTNVLNRADMR